ncbi:MAG: S-methyl-5-thioribose-1-phosphate isomerase [Anaerovoracaceae bacterium]|nr:S-methyl-5-thioribose-1-phosphate isomerase [Bacillota bacterium]MDY2670069.1 S-methyl-5-thioribose-1-phosphate isomerase [Anaerovoracaceae bacterium]
MKTDFKNGDYDTVGFSEDGRRLAYIDQTLLPNEVRFVETDDLNEMRQAIYLLKVRGAPAIGVAAAIGVYVLANKLMYMGYHEEDMFLQALQMQAEVLASARPTAVNLKWAVNRMMNRAQTCVGLGVDGIVDELKREATLIRDQDIEVCRKLGENGLEVLEKGQGILTHCNAGRLATVRYGTATSPIYLGQERGYDFKVYADETRPLLQGARLTSFELASAGVDVTLICDDMAASVMKQGKVQTVITGCDRVALNGDAANKIGTLGVAVMAKHFGIPFYIAAPTSSIDFSIPSGDSIVIEERDGDEIKNMWYEKPMAPEAAKTYNPAFDVTDADLITGIITEYGIVRPPYRQTMRELRDTIKREKEKANEMRGHE